MIEVNLWDMSINKFFKFYYFVVFLIWAHKLWQVNIGKYSTDVFSISRNFSESLFSPMLPK